MRKALLPAAVLALALVTPALADDDRGRHGRDFDRDRRDHRDDRWDRRADRRHHDGRRDHRRAHRHWRHHPPAHYRFDVGYRSAYELAWRDWHAHGRHNRHWHRHPASRASAWRAGYEAGWRDASRHYRRGYRPAWWAYDPRDGWYFSVSFAG